MSQTTPVHNHPPKIEDFKDPILYLLSKKTPEQLCRDEAMKALMTPEQREFIQDLVVIRWLGRRAAKYDS